MALLEAIEQRVKQFRRDDEIWPFRRPHDPLDLSPLFESAVPGVSVASAIDAVRSRSVITIEWTQFTDSPTHQFTNWSAWAVTLPSGLHVYCDSGGGEHRLLASVKRGSAMEADRFFLELLAESRGRHFGIEMDGTAPDRIRTSIDDREFLADVFVDLFEGTGAEAEIRARTAPSDDFRVDVERWLGDVLSGPQPARRPKQYPRLREL